MFHQYFANTNICGNRKKCPGNKNCEISLFVSNFAISLVTSGSVDLQDRRNATVYCGYPAQFGFIYPINRGVKEALWSWKQLAAVSPVIYIDTVARSRSKFMQATRLVKTNDRSETIEDPAGAGSIINL